jgi:hypothetical protein
MSSRIKTIGIIAIIGFAAGVIAQLTISHFIPWLREVLPSFKDFASVIGAGIAGAILTVLVVSVWAYLSKNKNNY